MKSLSTYIDRISMYACNLILRNSIINTCIAQKYICIAIYTVTVDYNYI